MSSLASWRKHSCLLSPHSTESSKQVVEIIVAQTLSLLRPESSGRSGLSAAIDVPEGLVLRSRGRSVFLPPVTFPADTPLKSAEMILGTAGTSARAT
jgi:hypothetical protein